MLHLIAWISILSALVVAVLLYLKSRQHPEPMKVMHLVWVLTALWGSFVALFFYRKWHSPKPAMAGMAMDMPMARPNIWRSVALSTLHCGAGCALADLVGEGVTYFFPLAIAGSLIAGSWTLDFVLALLFGIFFQYAAMRQMQPSVPWKQLVVKAAKADVLSLTAWQVGMYGWMAICYFVLFAQGALPKDSAVFWLMMQVAMLAGFCTAFPMNYLLIRLGVKKGSRSFDMV